MIQLELGADDDFLLIDLSFCMIFNYTFFIYVLASVLCDHKCALVIV
jgi:hypothetical protein